MYVLFFKDYPYKGASEEAILSKIQQYGQSCLKKAENSEFDDLIRQLYFAGNKPLLILTPPIFENNKNKSYFS